MQTDHPHTISRSALAFLSGTSLSRITGLGRDMAMAFCFGSHPVIAAFMVAFRFSNLFRRLFGEGQMPAGFVPYFEASRQEAPEKGALFFRDLFHSMATFLILFIAAVEAALYGCWKWGGFSVDSQEILLLTMAMLPGTIFVCLFSLSSSLLQCEKRYFLPSIAPVAFNLVWIAAALFWRDAPPEQAVAALALALIVAFALQWLTTLPATLHYLRQHLSWQQLFQTDLFSPQIRALAKPLVYGMVGVGAVQVNSALDPLFARWASLEGPAYLWYSIRMEQLPLALFGIALASALLPPLARAIQEKNRERYQQLLQFSLERSFAWIFPCVMGIFVLGAASVNLLYGRGDFSEESTLQTLLCLWGYGIGLLPSVVVLLFAPAFYADQDFKTPLKGALYAVVLNSALNGFMVFFLEWGAFSVAIATSVAAFFNALFLAVHLKRRAGIVFPISLFFSCAKVASATLLAGGATLLVGHHLTGDPTWEIALGQDPTFVRAPLDQILQFFTLAGCFGVLLFSYTWMLSERTEPLANTK